ncbi:helix-turn-helix domain-containing protein [Actinoallomurus sp. NBC_01490]|jgi:transcriptional regulator with XRE-family HTH domain|uniref:helix-turn-helix domain-containing protein n=1 Tax=Actinoallomurus sp. NBC_01490 TaxID=2903557 RepID=UPI002E369BB5|nr:helix-turn-helix transcriptional regulator [Actinoallomurus sp. NBC_01490]
MEYTPMAIWGRELKHYRQAAGLTQAELAAKINYSTSLISQIETGQIPATPEFAEACDEELDTGGALTRILDYRKGAVFPSWLLKWITYEEGAESLKTYQSNVVYSLLQTEAYASALLGRDEAETAARLKRQAILDRPEPPALHVVLDEVVLWRDIGGPKAMYEQLMRLAEISPSCVKIQILPNNANLGRHAPFVLATLTDGSACLMETPVHGLVTVSPQDLAGVGELWETILADALPVNMSKDLIKRTAEERWAS